MKKQKKQKLLSLWNKLKKPLMILSFVGNILFLLFIIVGCVGVKKKSVQTNAESNQSVLVTDLSGTKWYMNRYVNTPIGNWDQLNVNQRLEYNLTYYWYEDYESSETPYDYRYETLRFFRPSSISESSISFYRRSGYPTNITAYENQTSWVEEDYRYISFSFGQVNNDTTNTLLINWFYSNATLLYAPDFNNTFYFNKQINYNAPFGTSIESPFFNYSWEENQQAKKITYDLPIFKSNGEYFNQIEIWIFKGLAMGYYDSNNQYKVNSNESTGYYNYMSYVNTIEGTIKLVNYRNFVVNSINATMVDSAQTILSYGSDWKSETYRTLVFSEDLTSEQKVILSQFNNQNFGDSSFSTTSGDIGLGNVFNLISQSFGAFTNIFRIEVLPNISIGLLLFLPLIVGIILFIIWLVKR